MISFLYKNNHFKFNIALFTSHTDVVAGPFATLMVGQCVPESDEQWKCYIQLLRIITLATSYEVTESTIHMMTMLIESYLTQYTKLYPGRMVPKLQFLIHLPRQIKL